MRWKRTWAVILAVAMMMTVLGGVAGAADPIAGENGYVSLHTYISKTKDPSVIKVTHTVQGRIDITPKKVVFVLDRSNSMFFDGDAAKWTGGYLIYLSGAELMSPGLTLDALDVDNYNAKPTATIKATPHKEAK